ncbi:MAG: glutamate racemase [Christensenellaceae bacterium]|nr:glutamate racemase [Christensenellaceae bacterium]
MKDRKLPIGFFDSGVGGLSVMKHAMKVLPTENFIYYGDDANAPYGTRTEEEIKELSLACGEFLYQKGVKAIVMACNTATSIAVYKMREKYQIPVISIEPAVKPAYEGRENGRILVMATPATIQQSRFKELKKRVGCEAFVIDMPCKGLVELIETGDFDDPRIEGYIREKFEPLKGEVIDGIVMGCTHYSFISDKISKVAKDYFSGKCEIYDGMYGMVNHLKNVLEKEGLANNSGCGETALYSSLEGSTETFRKILEK